MYILIGLLLIMAALSILVIYGALVLSSEYDDAMEELEEKMYTKEREEEEEDERTADI